MSLQASRIPASAAEIRSIVGDLDDEAVLSILATGATVAEVLEAVQWLKADDSLGEETGHTRSGAAGAVYAILLQEEEPEDR